MPLENSVPPTGSLLLRMREFLSRMISRHREYITRQGALISDFGFEEDECNPEPAFTIYLSEIIDGIKNELIKEGKPFR